MLIVGWTSLLYHFLHAHRINTQKFAKVAKAPKERQYTRVCVLSLYGKNKTIKCTEPAVTEPVLLSQLAKVLRDYALPKSWADEMHTMLNEDEKRAEQSSGVFISQARERIKNLQSKLQRLLGSYLDQDIDQITYKTKQAELMSEKKSLGRNKSASQRLPPMRRLNLCTNGQIKHQTSIQSQKPPSRVP